MLKVTSILLNILLTLTIIGLFDIWPRDTRWAERFNESAFQELTCHSSLSDIESKLGLPIIAICLDAQWNRTVVDKFPVMPSKLEQFGCPEGTTGFVWRYAVGADMNSNYDERDIIFTKDGKIEKIESSVYFD